MLSDNIAGRAGIARAKFSGYLVAVGKLLVVDQRGADSRTEGGAMAPARQQSAGKRLVWADIKL